MRTGRARSRYRSRVVLSAYVDTGALDIVCPNCAAPVGHWCMTPDGRDRRMPCVKRTLPLVVEVDSKTGDAEPTPREMFAGGLGP